MKGIWYLIVAAVVLMGGISIYSVMGSMNQGPGVAETMVDSIEQGAKDLWRRGVDEAESLWDTGSGWVEDSMSGGRHLVKEGEHLIDRGERSIVHAGHDVYKTGRHFAHQAGRAAKHQGEAIYHAGRGVVRHGSHIAHGVEHDIAHTAHNVGHHIGKEYHHLAHSISHWL